MNLVTAAISMAISLAVFVIMASILEAMRRRGMDPVAAIARVLSPDVAPVVEEDEVLV